MRSKHLSYAQYQKMEPAIRAGVEAKRTDGELAREITELLGQTVSEGQIRHFRTELGLAGVRLTAHRYLTVQEIRRLEEMLMAEGRAFISKKAREDTAHVARWEGTYARTKRIMDGKMWTKGGRRRKVAV